jgi:hypothetical protein
LKYKKHVKGKPSLLDKIVGNIEAVIGKTTHNPTMTAKGEEIREHPSFQIAAFTDFV